MSLESSGLDGLLELLEFKRAKSIAFSAIISSDMIKFT